MTLLAAAHAAAQVPACSGAHPGHRNGVLIVMKSHPPLLRGGRLYTVRPDGTHLRPLTRPRHKDWDMVVAPAPDGRRAMLQRFEGSTGLATFAINLQTGRLRRLAVEKRAYFLSGIGAWRPVSKPRLAMTRWDPGRIELVPPGPGTLSVFPSAGPPPDQLSWSPNGRCLVGLEQRTRISILPAAGGQAFGFRPPGLEFIWGPIITPDGRHVAFTASETPSGPADVYESALDGAGLRKLAEGPWPVGENNYVIPSPDGSRLAYTDRRGTVAQSIIGHKTRRLLRGLYAVAWAPRPR